MPSLSESQRAFAQAVLDPGRAAPDGVRSHLRPRPEKRFAVYRNNVYASLINLLQGTFPVTARLLGEEFFRAAARVFVEQHPPASPVLMRYGDGFAAFLDDFEPVADVPYIGDVARLERAWSEAYHAADRAPARLDEMQGIAPEQAERLMVELHPSLRLVRSRFPVVTIWTANCDGGETGRIDAGAGSEDALVVRPGLEVEVRRLPPGGAAFILALQNGRTLAASANIAAGIAPAFDLQDNLTGLMRSGAIAALRPGDAATGKTDA